MGVSAFWSGVPCFTEGAESSVVFLESCWANAGTTNSSAERTTTPGERRNFITNSCPGPGPRLRKLYARSNVELLTILMSWTPKGHRRLSGKRVLRCKILATFQSHNHWETMPGQANGAYLTVKLRKIRSNVGRRPVKIGVGSNELPSTKSGCPSRVRPLAGSSPESPAPSPGSPSFPASRRSLLLVRRRSD